MAIRELIPINTFGHYKRQYELEGDIFTFEFHFNSRENAWYFDLFDSEGTPIRRSIKITTGFPWLRQVALAGRPPGDLIAVDASGNDRQADFESLGSTVKLLYFEESDVP